MYRIRPRLPVHELTVKLWSDNPLGNNGKFSRGVRVKHELGVPTSRRALNYPVQTLTPDRPIFVEAVPGFEFVGLALRVFGPIRRGGGTGGIKAVSVLIGPRQKT